MSATMTRAAMIPPGVRFSSTTSTRFSSISKLPLTEFCSVVLPGSLLCEVEHVDRQEGAGGRCLQIIANSQDIVGMRRRLAARKQASPAIFTRDAMFFLGN